jgi:hypothetical protein
VGSNPLRYVDPRGLVLFAFDGTGNTDDEGWLKQMGSSLSNVWQFSDLYNDGSVRYVSGVGTIHHDQTYGDIDPANFAPLLTPASWKGTVDMGFNYSGPARIARMVRYLDDESEAYEDDHAMNIDIIGFSRGAAQGRDFANRIVNSTVNGWYNYKVQNRDGGESTKCQKVAFRFLGLFDTVLSTNSSGSTYSLEIPEEFSYVAQAVALNEHRGRTFRNLPGSLGAFSLESITGDTIPIGQTRVERGFIGAHADIGGGFGESESQLSQVALAWMVEQAKAAKVPMGDSPLRVMEANPVIHDKSDNQYAPTGAPVAPVIEDRKVLYRNGTTTTQAAMKDIGMSWADTLRFISYLPADGPFIDGYVTRVPRTDYVTGTVDMRGYLKWLNENGYNLNMIVN